MLTRLVVIVAILIATVSSATVAAEERVHVLQRGETVYTLARRYQVSAERLMEYNSIADPTRLAVGTRIVVPGTYVVQQGEYVFSIARKLGVNWLELLEVNGLDRDDVVRPGDVLFVPASAARTAVAPPDTTGSRTQPSDRDEPADTERGEQSDPEERYAPDLRRVTPDAPVWPHPGERELWDGKFPGVVMRGSVGDEFISVTSGVVEYVGPFSSFGKLILVRSTNGYLYGYAGADRVLVEPGARVATGTSLGTVGFSPAFESAMVLFTVWRNNRYVDPETAPRG